MSDFVSQDILPDLWEEILSRHWTFLESEESVQKLEERKKLEICLKEFLSVAPHDRKFFLPETSHVLKKSIRELDDFSANKAIIGFESISQYANNLFTKPWRKEFRALKTYSGFFQHEIKSNLLDAEKLFEAMGYRRVSNELLVLEGPICPDQVCNVSRDALAAYVECQIIKRIYTALIDMGVHCDWQDVFNYREKTIGGCSTAIKTLAYTIQEHRLCQENILNAENCYATIKHTPKPFSKLTPQCQNCSQFCKTQPFYMHQQQQYQFSNGSKACALHPNLLRADHPNDMHEGDIGDKLIDSLSATSFPQHGFVASSTQAPQMSHSRSLEHYNDPPTLLPHRHSFDHQQQGCMAEHYSHPPHHQNVYESPYDCIDGVSMGSSVSYAAVPVSGTNCNVNATYAHPYNVKGNRYPLPFNISNQLNAHYGTPQMNGNNIKTTVGNGYANAMKVTHNCNYHPQPPLPPMRHNSSADNTKKLEYCRQRSFVSDQLIDFDDRATLISNDFHAQLNSMTQNNLPEKESGKYDYHRNMMHSKTIGTYAHPMEVCRKQIPMSSENGCACAREEMHSGKWAGLLAKNSDEQYIRKSIYAQGYADGNNKSQSKLKNRAANNLQAVYTNDDLSDVSNDSAFDGFVNVDHSEESPTQASKNQDGVGSFERWNYVFQNLDRTGNSKKADDQCDLLVKSLDLDSLNLTNDAINVTNEKRRTNPQLENKEAVLRPASNGEKSRKLEKVTEKRDSKPSKQEKSILKPLNKNTAGRGDKKINKLMKASSQTSSRIVNSNNNNNNNNNYNNNKNDANKKVIETHVPEPTVTGNGQANVSIQSVPNEWSCSFCTYLNPLTKNICEMCCRSKDFNLKESLVSQTPTYA